MAYNSGFVNSRYQILMRRQPRQNGSAFRKSVIQNPKYQLVPSIWSISCTRAQRFSRIQSGASTWVKGVSTYKCPATDPTWASWLGTEHIIVLIYLTDAIFSILISVFFSFPATDLQIQRGFGRNMSAFFLEGPEKENFITIPSGNFHNNG